MPIATEIQLEKRLNEPLGFGFSPKGADVQFNPSELSARDNYQLLVHAVVPRPIAWISTLSEAGVANLAPYSFFTVASCNPPVLSVTHVPPRSGEDKDTLVNLRSGEESVVNIVSSDLVEQMNATAEGLPRNISEFEKAGLDTVASHAVNVPGVAQAKVRFECRLREIKTVSAEITGGTLMLLDVIHIHVDDSLLVDQRISPSLLDAVGKMGGDEYTHTRDRFSLARP